MRLAAILATSRSRTSFMEDDDQTIESAEVLDTAEKWDRRPDESPAAHNAFVLWMRREKRQLVEVAQKLGSSVQNVGRWAQRHDWKGRAWAFDVRQEEIEREQLARDR